ncbi:hypothetical protein [Solibacillus sp. FSL H8-0538]|uniref:hypothetical protein n=1 Tax=Solibacillus sp. FSL H8-0538 TaxID=2921400 RepID=UPI0030F5DD1B
MKFVHSLYASMVLIIVINLISETILDGEYSGIALWISLVIFTLGTAFYINAKYYLSGKT